MSAFTRRKFLHSTLLGGLASSWLGHGPAFGQANTTGALPASYEGVSDDEIVLGTSAAFSGPSRGLGIELYRGAQACFAQVNEQGEFADGASR